MKRRRALIFGVSGQDGAYLAALLADKGYQVHGVSRDAATASFQGLKATGAWGRVRLHSAAPNDMRAVLALIKASRPDEVYNLSGQSSVSLSFEQPMETHESIIQATLNMLEAIRFARPRARFYNASSGECFGDTQGRLADERTPFRPRSPYGVAKAAAFWMTANYRAAYGLHACSGLLFNHESPLRPARYVTRKICAAAARIARGSREQLRLGDLSVRRDWGWAPEYVEAMWRMLQLRRPEDLVIATGRVSSLREFLEEAFRAAGLHPRRHVKVDKRLFRPSEIQANGGDASRARKLLKWKPRSGMRDVARAMVRAELESLAKGQG